MTVGLILGTNELVSDFEDYFIDSSRDQVQGMGYTHIKSRLQSQASKLDLDLFSIDVVSISHILEKGKGLHPTSQKWTCMSHHFTCHAP